MTMLWAWESSVPGAAAAGVCDDMERAQKAAAQWMRAHGAEAGLLEQVLLAIGAGSLAPHHERTGVALRARRRRDGGIRWRAASAGRPGRKPAPAGREVSLTAREREVASAVAEGLTDRQVAARLFISERTVHAHLRAAYGKTGARNRVQLANWLTEQPGLPDADRLA